MMGHSNPESDQFSFSKVYLHILKFKRLLVFARCSFSSQSSLTATDDASER